MSTDTADDDRLESRVRGLEATTDQLNERIGELNTRIGRLEDRMDDLQSEMNALRDSVRNWAVFTVLAIGTLLTLFQFL